MINELPAGLALAAVAFVCVVVAPRLAAYMAGLL